MVGLVRSISAKLPGCEPIRSGYSRSRNNMAAHVRQVKKLKHHDQEKVCGTRARYRQGRRATAVKVYTVNQESKYLLIQNVPIVGVKDELEALCSEYGSVDEVHALDDYPTEEYTEVYCVKYQQIKNARFAKKKLDERSFFGGCLHVCYAPEFETVNETREKLDERRRVIEAKLRNYSGKKWDSGFNSNDTQYSTNQVEIIPEEPQVVEPETYIWAGKTYTVEKPVSVSEVIPNQESAVPTREKTSRNLPFMPRQLKRPQPIIPTNLSTETVNFTTKSIREKMNEVSEPQYDITFRKRKKL